MSRFCSFFFVLLSLTCVYAQYDSVAPPMYDEQQNGYSALIPEPRVKVDKLSVAFQAVKEEIIQRAHELKTEKKWSGAVKKLVKNYRTKVGKVQDHITDLSNQTHNLLRKKKQIQNVQLQQKLTGKLGIAQANMSLLQNQLTHINNKESEFTATERNLKQTMRQLRLHLRKLKDAGHILD